VKRSKDRRAFLGWQGFGLEHPVAWELSRLRGDRRKSYLALDDGSQLRLEVSWRPIARKAPIENVASRQIEVIKRAARRRRIEIELDRKQRIGRPRGFEYEAFTWNADVSACELLARCTDCRRVVRLRVSGQKGHPPRTEARKVFSSLTCYCGKDFERWGTFGLDVKIPVRFDLLRQSLKTGVCELGFSDRTVELTVTRVSMGRTILEKEKMVPWFERLAAALLKPFEVHWQSETFRGHVGYAASGGVKGAKRLLKVFRSRRRVAVRCFYCDVSDKIYAVSAEGPGEVEELVETVCEGLVCHD